eukprot:g3937.t1
MQYGKQSKRLATKLSRKRQKFIPFRKSKICRCGLCFILPGISFFISLCIYYYVAYFDKSNASIDGEASVSSSSNSIQTISSRITKLPIGIPSRSAFIVINLARRKDRWSCVSKEFQRENVIVERFVATDASIVFSKEKRESNIMKLEILSKSAKDRLVRDVGINTGHLATFISHTNAIHTIVNRELKFGCIFEDDVSLQPNFLQTVSTLYTELPKDWDIFLLNHFCHQNGCDINDGLKPVTKNLMPIKMFYSGAGYCLNANSARKILSTLPCEHKSYCTVAIDAYMGLLVKQGFLKAYRPNDKVVLIPQDLMRMKDYQVKNNDCFSSFESDIVKFWKPQGPRHGHGCVFNHIGKLNANNDAHIRVRSNSKTYIIPNKRSGDLSVQGFYIETVEGDIVIGRSFRDGIVLNYPVQNMENTFFLYQNAISVVVSSDLWRGVSISVNNLGASTIELYWRYNTPGILSSSYKDIFLTTLIPKQMYSSYIPNKDRILVAKPYGTNALKVQLAKHILFVQPLNVLCHDNAREVGHGGR